MEAGTVKFFIRSKGYGFIIPDNGEKEVFVHRSNVETEDKNLETDQRVEFVLEPGMKGVEAKQVHIV
jgi:CspA family cold shock protein